MKSKFKKAKLKTFKRFSFNQQEKKPFSKNALKNTDTND